MFYKVLGDQVRGRFSEVSRLGWLLVLVMLFVLPRFAVAQNFEVDTTRPENCLGSWGTTSGTVVSNNCTFPVNMWYCFTGGDQWTTNRCWAAGTSGMDVKGPWTRAPNYRLNYQQQTPGLGDFRSGIGGDPGRVRIAACRAESGWYLVGEWGANNTPIYECRRNTSSGGGGGGGSGTGGGNPQTDLKLYGSIGWQFTGTASVTLRADRVSFSCSGATGTSGALRLRLAARPTPYPGGAGSYTLGARELNSLSCNQYYSNISQTVPYQKPPEGSWYTTMFLDQYTSSGWVIKDWVNFDGRLEVKPQAIRFAGGVSYQVQGGQVRLTADRVENDCPFGMAGGAANLRMSLWAYDQPFSGGSQAGSVLGTATLGSLSCNQYFSNATGSVAYSAPSASHIHRTMFLEKQNSNGTWEWIEYVNFATQSGGGTTNHTLTLTRNGSGSVTSSPVGINCGSTCQASFASGTSVTLTATPAASWSGSCSGTSTTCTVTMSQARSVTATFSGGGTTNHTLTLTRNGNGTVTSSPGGINCGSSCQGTFAKGTQVTLTATPAAGWRFKQWGGGCSGVSEGNVCRISISQNRNATVHFEQDSGPTTYHTLNLTRNGSGSVTSSPGGINCGSTCQGTFAKGTQVTLTATPAAGWRFQQWGGGCSGVSEGNVCRISISQNRNATVHFQQVGGARSAALFFDSVNGPTYRPLVRNSGAAVRFAWRTQNLPAGTACQIRRLPNHDYKKGVSPIAQGTLTDTNIHTWATGARKFYLWCSDGTTSPEISLDIVSSAGQIPSATLRFDRANGPTTKAITRYDGTPVRFAWQTSNLRPGTTCQIRRLPNHDYKKGVSPVSGGTLVDTNIHTWATGARQLYLWCSNGLTSPVITLNINDTVTGHTLTVQKSGDGTGTVTSSPSGINCGATCSASFAANTTVTLTAAASGGSSVFTGWTGACSGTASTCTVTMNAAKNVGAVFANLGESVREISAGSGHTCALTGRGAVRCWGSNSSGQLGDGTTIPRQIPVTVLGLSSGVQAISAGGGFTCALTSAGAVKCWGNNGGGRLGDGTTINRATPVDVGLPYGAQAISAGANHACALLMPPSQVRCWGGNQGGQLGDGTTVNRLTPVPVSGLGVTLAVSAGGFHTCAVTMGGAARCWGENFMGQLGNSTDQPSLTPVTVSGLSSGVRAISAGAWHACALTATGAVRCWGDNTHRQLGDGTTAQYRLTPVLASGLSSGVQAISTGSDFTCVLINANVGCWGGNNSGQLGNGSTTDSPVMIGVAAGYIRAISAGAIGSHVCALGVSGGVLCWGNNSFGQLGDGTTTNRSFATTVSGFGGVSGFYELSVGGGHTCALTTASFPGLQCWGANAEGQLGDGTTINRLTPTNVPMRGFIAVTTGFAHTCALGGLGDVYCWGQNQYGQIGDGTRASRNTPARVLGFGLNSHVIAIKAGGNRTCALTSAGGVKCWGKGSSTEAGGGASSNDRLTPTDVPGLSGGFKEISVGDDNICALNFFGEVKCWGSVVNSLGPVAPWAGSFTQSVSVGGNYICGIDDFHNRICLGDNSSSQFGSAVSHLGWHGIPVTIGENINWRKIQAATYSSCGVTREGAAMCWGSNQFGQLGSGSTNTSFVPYEIPSLSEGVQTVSVAVYHACALDVFGRARCWGNNSSGQLGDGTNTRRLTPTAVVGF